ncbi:PREDICTED: probable inactive receptor kinase At1g27190 [Nicotiana attenuata]|uniref:Inactive receptor kinase n=1 Tax=Nicotiana attenuata TaxID=49451 RepID=A0A1J6IAU1_NICAT|nr:PREDICTED: probable inactive receptor kinase At1g27190 [Nicotiana attenuata]OIS97655.1 putative inactive receptor kinase [Nicotiana attenuata]
MTTKTTSPIFFFTLLLLTFTPTPSFSIENDIKCLEGIKSALSDPLNKLSSWSFSNTSVAASICKLVGVSCWNEKENRLISLQLPSMSLSGSLPPSLQYCTSLQSLDLSGNSLSGSLPVQLCSWLPYLVNLDLSGNSFSGSIPPEFINCKFLNTLLLNDNKLTGSIPFEIGRLDRLKRFSVSNNGLSGPVPDDLDRFLKDDFEGNNGLCGEPLGSKCSNLSNKNLVIIIAAGIVGAAGSLILGFGIWWWFLVQPSKKKNRELGDSKGNNNSSDWVEKLRAFKLVQVTLFQKPINKIKLNDLLAATNSFDSDNIVISTRTGISYRAMLPDGSALAIKRLSSCKVSTEKQFRSEMNRLGQLRHPNLVPLLGFCVVDSERLLVYKHMQNGSLYSLLHGNLSTGVRSSNIELSWPARLGIAAGAARGLAWLHHGCQPPYLHQYLSSNVILVDDDLDARITDFGLARLVGSSDSNDSSFVNGDLGELGYVAPEYSSTLVASMKGDVYSFGVVMLELVTGRKPLGTGNAEEGFKGSLVDWVNQLSSSGQSRDAIDKSFVGRGQDDEILRVLQIACSCAVSRPKDRPSMYTVYQSLKSMVKEHCFSEHFDEFPINLTKQGYDHKD